MGEVKKVKSSVPSQVGILQLFMYGKKEKELLAHWVNEVIFQKINYYYVQVSFNGRDFEENEIAKKRREHKWVQLSWLSSFSSIHMSRLIQKFQTPNEYLCKPNSLNRLY